MVTVRDYHRWIEAVRRIDPTFELEEKYWTFKQTSESLRSTREELPELKHSPGLLQNRLDTIRADKETLRRTGLQGKSHLRRKLKSLYDGRMPRLSEHLEIYFSLNGRDLEALLNGLGYIDTTQIKSLKTWTENAHLLNWCFPRSVCNHYVEVKEHPYKSSPKMGEITPYIRLMSIRGGEMERVYILGDECIPEGEKVELADSSSRKRILELRVGSVIQLPYPQSEWIPASHPERQNGYNPLFDMIGRILDTATERGIQCYYVNGRAARYENFVTNADIVQVKN